MEMKKMFLLVREMVVHPESDKEYVIKGLVPNQQIKMIQRRVEKLNGSVDFSPFHTWSNYFCIVIKNDVITKSNFNTMFSINL